MSTLRAAWAIAVKDWRRFVRQPFLLVISVVIPLVFILLYSIIVALSATGPIRIAQEDQSPQAAAMVRAISDIHSVEAPYFEVLSTDPATARRAYAEGDALAMIVIPAGFGDRVAAGDATVELHLHNINSDYSKNLRLRLDKAVRTVNDETAGPVVTVTERSWLAVDPTMAGYISTSLLLFGCLYAAMVNTGLQVASEWNDRTIKSLLLAPVGRGALVLGKVIAGLGQSAVSVAIVLAVLVGAMGFHPRGNPFGMAAIMVLTLLMGAGTGAAVAVASKKTLPVASALIALAIALFLVSGNEESLRGLAWGQPITALWGLARILPPTYAFTAARSLFLTGDATHLVRDLTIVAVTAIAVLALAVGLLRRAYTQLTGGQ